MTNEEVVVFAVEQLVRFKAGPRWCIDEVYYRRDSAWEAARKTIASSQEWKRPLTRRDVRTRRMIAKFE